MPLIAVPQLAREAFFLQDFPDALLVDSWKQMQDESYRAFLDLVALDLPNPHEVKTRLLVLGAPRDNVLSASEIAATART